MVPHITKAPELCSAGQLLCLGMKKECFSGGHALLFYGSALAIRSAKGIIFIRKVKI